MSKAISRRSVLKLTAAGILVVGAAYVIPIANALVQKSKGCPSGLYDDFNGADYTLTDNQVSPNGKWQCVYTGYGTVGVTNGVFHEEPTVAGVGQTSAASTISTATFPATVNISLSVNTLAQIANRPPNTWEVAWVLFNYVDVEHNYYFIVKPNGIELGKYDGGAQTFLYTANTPTLAFDQWSTWQIDLAGNHIVIYVNSVKVVDYVDTTQSTAFANGGQLVMYCEDSSVEFDNVYAAPPCHA